MDSNNWNLADLEEIFSYALEKGVYLIVGFNPNNDVPPWWSSLNENKVEGTGLGLNLVKQIVEKLHGGRVFAQSQVGTGSVFGFELPLAKKSDFKKSYITLQD